ncbi:MAG: hypothetical protein E7017_00525 [Alphaproteobacteria bacterium]|nr:hypothetical protein [Alphaproteobacteria bacterium]
MKKYVYPLMVGIAFISLPLGWHLPQSQLITAIVWLAALAILFVYGKKLVRIFQEFWGDEDQDKYLSVCLFIILLSAGFALSAWWLGDFSTGFLGLGFIIWLILGWVATTVLTILSYMFIGVSMIIKDIIDILKKK